MTPTLTTSYVHSVTAVSVTDWNRLAGTDNPFVQHQFLAALESSGSVGPASTGWSPHHLLVHDQGQLVAAMPLYEKTDSYGEYIFDWAWARASLSAGLAYYPKLVSAVPFTPASGRRVLLAQDVSLAKVVQTMAQSLRDKLAMSQVSGVHILFCSEQEAEAFAAEGFCRRASFQYHWHRMPHWHSFDDFLHDLRAPNRKQIRRERKRAADHGLSLTMRPVAQLSPQDVATMYGLYRQTVWEKGANAYLTPSFFAQLPQLDTAWVAMAHRGDQAVAGALYFAGDNTLFGRYWGASEALDALHFELCYYQPIAFCTAHKIDRFEAGAQGEHKIKRGLVPNGCHSVHLLAHQGLHQAVVHACHDEHEVVRQQMAMLSEHSPYHREHVQGPDPTGCDRPL